MPCHSSRQGRGPHTSSHLPPPKVANFKLPATYSHPRLPTSDVERPYATSGCEPRTSSPLKPPMVSNIGRLGLRLCRCVLSEDSWIRVTFTLAPKKRVFVRKVYLGRELTEVVVCDLNFPKWLSAILAIHINRKVPQPFQLKLLDARHQQQPCRVGSLAIIAVLPSPGPCGYEGCRPGAVADRFGIAMRIVKPCTGGFINGTAPGES